MRRIALLAACLAFLTSAAADAQTSTRRPREERSVLVPTRTYQSSEERVARRLQREEVPLLARQPELAPTPAFEGQPQPPVLPADEVSTRRPRSPIVPGRTLESDGAPPAPISPAPIREGLEEQPQRPPMPQPSPQSTGDAQPMPQPTPQSAGDAQPMPQPTPQSAGDAQPMPQPTPQSAGDDPPMATFPADEPALEPGPQAVPDSVTPIRTARAPEAKRNAQPAPTTRTPAAGTDNSLLSTAGAALQVDALGPRSITIGKPANYRVRLRNLARIDGDNIVVRVDLPAWVDVVGGRATVGQAQRVAETGAETNRLTWSVDRIAAGSQEFLDLQLIPRKSTPFDVKVEWTAQPRKAQARVMVQSPQLAIQIVGPREVMYGAKAKYTIHVSNPGNGAAEGVTLHVSSGDGIQSKQFGSLAAGARETVELELIAREAGELLIEAAAVGDGDLEAESTLPVRIRRAKLEMALAGPAERFAGQDAIYTVMVANVGDAPATNLIGQVSLPQGAEYLGGISAASVNGGRLQWRLPDLAPNTKQQYRFQVTLPVPGQQRLVAQAASNNELLGHAAAMTQVVAIADLKLSIDDPRGPVPTGADAIYEVTVVNRGSREAENVRVVAQFSKGIEPISFKGHTGELADNGQVLFSPIPKLNGGETIVLKVIARAGQPGTHRFRATVTCDEKEVQHIAEETTRYFARLEDSATTQPAAAPAYEAAPAQGTANDPIDLTPTTPTPLETSPLEAPFDKP